MALPEPRPGLVIRYDYLWKRESDAVRLESKDRPTCLVAASDASSNPRWVVLLPITHSKPTGDIVGIEIPQKVKHAIGLDDEPSWVIVSEYNVDEWPNGGISSVPGRPESFAYGFIPPGLFAAVKQRFLELAKAGKSASVKR